MPDIFVDSAEFSQVFFLVLKENYVEMAMNSTSLRLVQNSTKLD